DRYSSPISTLIGTELITELPVQTRRLYELVALAPATVFTPGWGVGGLGFNLSLFQPFVSMAGSPSGRGDFWYLDGVNVKNTRLNGDAGGMPAFNPPPEIVSEMRVLTNNYSAEFGDGWGGAVVMATKSGTNTIHGSVFDYEKNDALDARNFFAVNIL